MMLVGGLVACGDGSSERLVAGDRVEFNSPIVEPGEALVEGSPYPNALRVIYDLAGDDQVLHIAIHDVIPSSGDEWCMLCVETILLAPDTEIGLSSMLLELQTMRGWLAPTVPESPDELLGELEELAVAGQVDNPAWRQLGLHTPYAIVGTTPPARLDWGAVYVWTSGTSASEFWLRSGPDGVTLRNDGTSLTLLDGSATLHR
jgi:hypothetical protein